MGRADVLVCPDSASVGHSYHAERIRIGSLQDRNVLHSPIRDRQESLPHHCDSVCPYSNFLLDLPTYSCNMAMDLPTLRKLVSLDANDPLSRFALGRKLAESGSEPDLTEAAEHLTFANQKSPQHLATYHILADVLIRLNRKEQARQILIAGIERVAGVGEGMGRDLGPAMQQMLDGIS